uniref:Glycoprotein 330-like n=1 Tax=Phallusia mammillata TaxID=59560 RepID=A0A6F9DJX9_9ASCI|nr:glycoprotein 330-like [Phallusia mammillata]
MENKVYACLVCWWSLLVNILAVGTLDSGGVSSFITSTNHNVEGTTATDNPRLQATNDSFFLSFACPDKSGFIDRHNFCDGYDDCRDGSDEIRYDPTLHEHLPGTKCARLARGVKTFCFLPSEYMCDNELDCYFGSDEQNCPHTFNCVTAFPMNMFRFRVQFCDNFVDCMDGSDEWKYGPDVQGFQCAVTKTRLTSHCMLPTIHRCDGISDCDDGTDECFCDSGSNSVVLSDKCFRCLDNTLVIPTKQLCDATFHCKDLSDECLCTNNRPAICEQICQANQDCGACKVGQVMCSLQQNQSAICVNRTQVCDQTFDCPDHEDEQNCAFNYEQMFNCSDGLQYLPKHVRFDNYTDCNDGSDETGPNLLYRCKTNIPDKNRPGAYIFKGPAYAEACDGMPDCLDMDDECNPDLCRNITPPSFCRFKNPKYGFQCPTSGTSLLGKDVCDGYPTCRNNQPHLSEDEIDCPERFYCADHGKSGLPIHIPLTARCNQISDCHDVSDEMGCDLTTHFYCLSEQPKYTPRHKVCDGVQDCKGGEDECQNCSKSPFSSDELLVSSPILQAIVWITGIFALFGNTAVFIHNGVRLWRVRSCKSAVAFVNRTLVLNLNLSDLLLGVYLICLGAVNSIYEGTYCHHDIQWRSSGFCAALGCLAVISVESSVFILTIMTTYRLLVLARPFSSINGSKRFGIAIAFSWILAITIAVLPLLPSTQDYFLAAVWYSNNPYLTNPTRNKFETFVERLQTFDSPNNDRFHLTSSLRSTTWRSLTESIAKLNSTIQPELYFGYYSAHGVCLPRLFPVPSVDRAWGYSMFIISVNFCAFLCMILTYIAIYRYSKNGSRLSRRGGHNYLPSLQTKISRIIITNFCCWIPICVMSFISVAGVTLSDDIYAVAAIVLLPINSAANPFLYSKLPDMLWQKFNNKILRKYNSTIRNRSGIKTVSTLTYHRGSNKDTQL